VQTAVVTAPSPPSNTGLPSITGSAVQGQTLTAQNGTWSNSPTGFAYQWQQCDGSGSGCGDIGGSTSQSYVVQAADVSHTLRVVVTASNAGGSTPATSPATAVVQAVLPTLGRTSVGAFRNTGGAGYLDTSGPYTLASSSSLVKLSGYLQGGSSAQPMRAVVYADSAGRPGALVAVSVEVTVQAGAVTGWVDFPVSGSPVLAAGKYWLGYWYGASSAQEFYDTVSGGGRYAPAVYSSTGSPPGSWPAGGSGDSIAFSLYATLGSVTPPSPPGNTGLPVVSGQAVQGQTLSASQGSWSNSPTGFAYQWQRCDSSGNGCQPVAGATASTYLLQGADVASTLRVVVTASNAGGSTPATSTQTAVVQAPAPPANTALPSITGVPATGQTLTAQNGSWSNSPTGYGYQWQSCDGTGAGCSDIGGATSQAYGVQAGDVSHTLRVVVTATNDGGSTAATSDPSAVVQAAPQTFGRTTVGSLKNTGGAGYLDMSGPYATAAAGSVVKLTGYLQGGTGAQAMRAVVYADSGGRPGALIAVSVEVTIQAGAPAGWVDFPLAVAASLPAGKYWLGYWYGNSRAQEYYDTVAGGGRYAPAAYSSTGNPPSTFPTGTGDSIGYSLYATLGP
jgi:hypothetical protein